MISPDLFVALHLESFSLEVLLYSLVYTFYTLIDILTVKGSRPMCHRQRSHISHPCLPFPQYCHRRSWHLHERLASPIPLQLPRGWTTEIRIETCSPSSPYFMTLRSCRRLFRLARLPSQHQRPPSCWREVQFEAGIRARSNRGQQLRRWYPQ